jgi:hypothetical protein
MSTFLGSQDMVTKFYNLFKVVANLQITASMINQVVNNPTNGSTLTVRPGAIGVWLEIIMPGTIAVLTIVLPATGTAINGQMVRITSTHTVTAPIFTSVGSTIIGGALSLGPDSAKTFVYSLDNTSWYLI